MPHSQMTRSLSRMVWILGNDLTLGPHRTARWQMCSVFALSSFAVAQTEASHPAHTLSWGVQGKEATMHGNDPQASNNQSEDGESSSWRHVSGNDGAGM